jgi:predicted PurR-regulated permease PerM
VLLGVIALIVSLCLLVLYPFADVIAWSAVLAIAFHPVHVRLVKYTGRVTLSALICSVLVVMMILLPALLLTGLAINQYLAMRDYLQELSTAGFDPSTIAPLRQISEWLARMGLNATAIMGWVTQYAGELGRATAGYSLAIAANISGVVVSFVFTIFATFLLLRDGEQLVRRMLDLLPFERARNDALLARIRDVIDASVYGVLVIAVIQGALSALMFWILGIPSAALWGVVTAVTSVLPLVGSAAVWGPGTIYLVAIGRWPEAIVLGVWGGLVVGSVDNFVRPRLVGERVGLSELVTFFALLGGLRVFGLVGVVMGPLLFAVAASILDVLTEEKTITPVGDVEAQ